MRMIRKIGVCIMLVCLLMATGCGKTETKEESSELEGNYYNSNTKIEIQISGDRIILFKEDVEGILEKKLNDYFQEVLGISPNNGYVEKAVNNMKQGCEFSQDETELVMWPVSDDSFSFRIKYFEDSTIAFLNESYSKK